MRTIVRFWDTASSRSWLLTAYIIIVFLLGGGSRSDVRSLIILDPLAILFCGIGLLTIDWTHIRRHGLLLSGFVALAGVMLLNLVPLPPEIWHGLPGREILIKIDQAVGLPDIWRPLTMTPGNGWQALFFLFIPFAAIINAIQLGKDDLFAQLPVFIVMGAISGVFGILQVIGSPNGPLYFYDITNNGSAVGLFANRNHAAVFLACLFPLLATYASNPNVALTPDQLRFRQLILAGAVAVTIPLILVTGSRSGLFVGLVGLLSAAFLYGPPSAARANRRAGGGRWKIGPGPVLAAICVVCLTIITAIFSRAEALNRIFEKSAGEDARGQYWAQAFEMMQHYMPWGSGLGSFVEAFKIFEPNSMLGPLYVNHAHNDWIEIALTLGAPGIFLLLAAVVAIAVQSVRLWRGGAESRRSIQFGKMSCVVIAMLGLASITDYPLRTPSLATFLAMCLVWLSNSAAREPLGSSQKTGVVGP